MPRLARLLIISCTAKKRLDTNSIPCIERYDGPTFRVLRKYLRQQSPNDHRLRTYVISAKFGLVDAETPIPYYDEVLTLYKAQIINKEVLASFSNVPNLNDYDQIFISAGQVYQKALEGFRAYIPHHIDVFISHGSPGRRASELRRWLYSEYSQVQQIRISGTARIRNIELCYTSKQVLDLARTALSSPNGSKNSSYFQTWYVNVDEQRVSPKWLVSLLSGLPLNRFGSTEARRVLTQLGIEVLPLEQR